VAVTTSAFRSLRGSDGLEPHVLGADQSNTSLRFGERLILKLFRRLHEGQNPDVEIGAFLSEQAQFPHVPRVAGYLEYRPQSGEPNTVAVLQGFVPNEGDAWGFTLDAVTQYFERCMKAISAGQHAIVPQASLVELTESGIPPLSHELIGPYLEQARLLGQRTAELHLALISHPDDPNFAAEPFTLFYQRSLFQSMRNLTEEVFEKLTRGLANVPEANRADAEGVLAQKAQILERFKFITGRNITAVRTRLHGDYHLGQVLWTGRDFMIIDFEGEPARPISARRIKRSPLRDTAGMIRSFHYAVHHGLRGLAAKGLARPENLGELEHWAEHWFLWTASAFLRSYLRTAPGAAFIPNDREELDGLLRVYLLEKAVYELGYELDHRPHWVHLPLRGILWLIGGQR
jgi:maltose alpha-D-glucosyltransferase / alpha-amylase